MKSIIKLGASFLVFCLLFYNQFVDANNYSENSLKYKNIFSPRMDYEQWKPLGHGDPLKNDPTFDYQPPVLDRVQYWVDPISSDTRNKTDLKLLKEIIGDKKKTEILLLGVSSKKPSIESSYNKKSDDYLKRKEQIESRLDSYDPFLKFIEPPKHLFGYEGAATSKHQSYFFPYFQTYYNQYPIKEHQKVPQTILTPPSLNEKTNYYSTTTDRTSSLVTISKANLVYQTSSSHINDQWNTTNESYNEIDNIIDNKNYSYGNKAVFPPNNEFKHSAIDPLNKQIYKYSTNSNDMKSSLNTNLKNPDGLLYSPMKSSNPENHSGLNGKQVYMMSKDNFKDNNFDYLANPSELKTTIPEIDGMSPPPPANNTEIFKNLFANTIYPSSILIKSKLSTRPPAYLLKNVSPFYSTSLPIKPMTLQSLKKTPSVINLEEMTTKLSSSTEEPTTTSSYLTTDPIFSHYKQPLSPIKGPFYLIIQGHSKVKTYGGSGNNIEKSLKSVDESKANDNSLVDQSKIYYVKNLHFNKQQTKQSEDEVENKNYKNLQSLQNVLDTNLGGLNINEYDCKNHIKSNDKYPNDANEINSKNSTNNEDRNDNNSRQDRNELRFKRDVNIKLVELENSNRDIKQNDKIDQNDNSMNDFKQNELRLDSDVKLAELRSEYKVSAIEMTSERYRKGFVENEGVYYLFKDNRKPNKISNKL